LNNLNSFAGELIGTFVLTFFGCSAVASSVLYSAHMGLFQVAGVWGIGVTLAIYATRHLSCAHLNPAVSLAMVIGGRMKARKLPVYLAAQFVGAFLAGLVVLGVFSTSIANFETVHHIIRGTTDSVKTAMMFGEYFPNPSFQTALSDASLTRGFFVEAVGTFLLVTIIFLLTEDCNVGRPPSDIAPIFIGLTVMAIISILAPLTQAGINPARDFGPRLVAYFSGWKEIAIPGPSGGFFTVYIMGPFTGGSVSALLFGIVLHPLMEVKNNIGACEAACPTLLSKGIRFIKGLNSH
jgi:glycerol uptake facilitator protein